MREQVDNASGRTGVSGFGLLIALFGALLVFLVVPNAGEVLQAAQRGEGVPGLFQARERSCVRHPGHEACSWQGEFRSNDGTVRRTGVSLYGNGAGLRTGDRTTARDVGRSGTVYRPDGSREWIINLLILTVGLLMILKSGVHRLIRRGRGAPGSR